MEDLDWTTWSVAFATQLVPGMVAVGLAIAAVAAARTRAMPALVLASGLSAALSLLGVLLGLRQSAHALDSSFFFDTIDAYALCALILVVLAYGLGVVAVARGRSRGNTA